MQNVTDSFFSPGQLFLLETWDNFGKWNFCARNKYFATGRIVVPYVIMRIPLKRIHSEKTKWHRNASDRWRVFVVVCALGNCRVDDYVVYARESMTSGLVGH